MAKKQIPTHPQGWKFAGRCGDFHSWHAGKNDYRITDGENGEVVAKRDQFGPAFHEAVRLNDLRKAGL